MSNALLLRYGLTRASSGEELTGITALPTLSSGSANAQIGWEFTVGALDITVTGLRWYAFGAYSGTLRLWRDSDAQLLASESINAAGGQWNTVTTSETVLTSGANYVVSVRWDGGLRNYNRCAHADVTFDSAITYVESRFASDDTYPSGLFSSTLIGGIPDIVFTA